MTIRKILLEDLKHVSAVLGMILLVGTVIGGPTIVAIHENNLWFLLFYPVFALIGYAGSVFARTI